QVNHEGCALGSSADPLDEVTAGGRALSARPPFRVRGHVVRSMCQKRVPKPTLKLQKSWSRGLLVPPLDGVLGGQVWLVYTTPDQGFCTPWTYTRGVCYKQTISLLEPITV